MKKISKLCFKVILLALAVASAAQPLNPQSKDEPKVAITGTAWSEGQLVVGIEITAPSGRSLMLGNESSDAPEGESTFTTKASWLVDLYSGTKILASKKYPQGPNMGWVRLSVTLAPGDSENFTAAFPSPPLPPLVNGKREDYHLELHLPGNLPPVSFKVPVPENAVAAPCSHSRRDGFERCRF